MSKIIKNLLISSSLLGLCLSASCGGGGGSDTGDQSATLENVLRTNGLIAFSVYQDSLLSAQALQAAISAFLTAPSDETFQAARNSWLVSREPYGQSEVYRFREGPIDQQQASGGGEGSINAWPLNEARVDYVTAIDGESGSGTPTTAISTNIISDAGAFPNLTPQALRDLNELDGDEGNVFTGYHAIEFLLWGQDVNADGSSGIAGRDNTPGQRRFTDYLPEGAGCTNGNCIRRGAYLSAAAQALVEDLNAIVVQWDPNTGPHYASFVAGGNASLARIMEGMGRLSFGELAGERINIALVTNSQEDEHSCFADNTHRDIALNAQGVQNSHLGTYTRTDGSLVSGPGTAAYLSAQGFDDIANRLTAALADTQAAGNAIDAKAKSGVPFDNQIQEGAGNAEVNGMIAGLIAQTQVIEEGITALGLSAGELDQDTEEFDL